MEPLESHLIAGGSSRTHDRHPARFDVSQLLWLPLQLPWYQMDWRYVVWLGEPASTKRATVHKYRSIAVEQARSFHAHRGSVRLASLL